MARSYSTPQPRVVYQSPDKRVTVKRISAGDFTLEMDGVYVSSHRTQEAAEIAGGACLHQQALSALSRLEATLA